MANIKRNAKHSSTKPAVEYVHTLEWALELLSGAIRAVATDKPFAAQKCWRSGFGLCVQGGPAAMATIEIRPCDIPCDDHGGPWGVWAHVTLRDGLSEGPPGPIFYEGNRAGACAALAKHCAPVISWIAAYWAAKAATAA